MDPNATLKEIRSIVKTNMDRDLEPDEADRLADLIEALDGWMSKGGYKPLVWIDVKRIEEKLPELPPVTYNRQSTEPRLFLVSQTSYEVLTKLHHERLTQLQRAHGNDTYLMCHLCWWIEKADIFLNDYPAFDALDVTDFYDEFVDPHMIDAMVVWLTNHTELPVDPGTILRTLVDRLVLVKKNNDD